MAPNELSTAAVRRLIEMAGADRVGDDAVDELGKILESFAVESWERSYGTRETCWQENSQGSGYSAGHKESSAALVLLVAGFGFLHLSFLSGLEG